MLRNTSPGAPSRAASNQGSGRRGLAIRALLLPTMWLAAVPLTAQTVRTDASNTFSQPCTSAKAVHDMRCPNYTGFSARLGGMQEQPEAARKPFKGDTGDNAAQGESTPSLSATPRLSLRMGRDIADGVASWYGPGFHGRKTANGERFDMNEMTAAHKTLPFGTRVLVKNPRTGKQVVVRINDRGPYARGRVIDLSKAAAIKLGLKHRGHDKVVLREVLGDDVAVNEGAARNAL